MQLRTTTSLVLSQLEGSDRVPSQVLNISYTNTQILRIMSTLAVELNTEVYAKIRKYVYVRVTFKECSKYYNSARSTKIKIKKSRCEERGLNSRAIISLSNYNCQRSGLSSQTTCHNEHKQKTQSSSQNC